jgi:hypothetical protein
VKLLKLSIVPAVLLFSVVMAAPAFAHEATLTVSPAPCQGGQVCIKVHAVVPSDTGNDVRILTFSLFGVKGGNETDLNNSVTVDLPASAAKDQTVDATPCFKAVTDQFDSFRVKLTKVTDKNGNDADLTITFNGKDIQFDKDHPLLVLDNIAPCVTQTSPSPSPSPSASASAATTTTTLANTGGFDFRFPLIGLILLVAGGTLYVIGASRGRSTTK